jgi:hypothetical protein
MTINTAGSNPIAVPHVLFPTQALRQRIEEVQVAMANRAAESAETIFRLKQDLADEKEKLLRSYR